MPACSPQRFLPNNLNLFATAILTPSSVLPVANKVKPIPFARRGTAQVLLTGTYTGNEQADYEIEITDTDVDVTRISTPTSSGAGSGTLTDIVATGAQQIYTVELSNAGTQTKQASVALEGAIIEAVPIGTLGNSIRIIVDQSTLVFADSNYSLLVPLSAGAGGPTNPLIGEGFFWDTAVRSIDGPIPAEAHRIAFGDDQSRIYLNYRQRNATNSDWEYHLIPALARDVPRGTRIQFVTGGRTVSITDGTDTEIYPDIQTAYDLLIGIRAGTQSALARVPSVVANDRSPTGQAAREFTLRTDAHAEVAYGSGSYYARGLEDVTVASGAGTQLVSFTCIATTGSDSPLARIGSERWAVESSLLGRIGTAVTGRPYTEPNGSFGATIPVRLPPSGAAATGRFTQVGETQYAPRTGDEIEPPICPVALSLGPDATDQTITMVYTAPETGDCACAGMAVPNLHTPCLGDLTEAGELMNYQTDTIERLKLLYEWYLDMVRGMSVQGDAQTSSSEAAAVSNPADGFISGVSAAESAAALTPQSDLIAATRAQNTESIRTIVSNFEGALARIDPLEASTSSPPAGLREDGCAAWDVAFTELQGDIADAQGSPALYLLNVPSDRYAARLNLVLISAGISPLGGADASILTSGDGCWRDWKGPYWKVTSTTKGRLAPLFSNHPYWSSRPAADGGYFSTHEWAMQLNIKCPQFLKYGDTLQFQINDAARGVTYQTGDVITLPIIAASPLYLTGGVNGSPMMTWNINGSVIGPLPPFLYDPDAPAPYSETYLAFTYTPGGIPNVKGDRFRFAVEGGHFRWRKDGGTWQEDSPPAAIPLGSVAIDAGLSATFLAGAAASFVAGDVFKFRALQPWAVSNTQVPDQGKVWKWDGTGAEYAADFGEVKQLDMFAMLHGLPAGATVVLWGGATSGATDWSEALTYRVGAIWKAIDRTARYVRIVITNATGGWIQWPWAGVPLMTALSADFMPRLSWQINRPGGNLQGGRYVGSAVSGDVSWSESALTEDDVGWSTEQLTGMVAMLNYVKRQNDQPVMYIPNVTRPADPVLFAHINADEVDFPDDSGMQRNIQFARRFSARIPLAGVWQ